ncbi:hypothetical protein INT48_004764 [Thamnidium elegans]|uniref:Hsp70 family protein n=1 Tax=Thamnidium elegans TaxID=101142 RepID=A0A8H7VQX7_9FUNG|nr:hypothetical protein INT48_004764 [Thamnidium elegans]
MKVFDYNSFEYIVSFDFGTTYSGCCYIHTGKNVIKALKEDDYGLIKDDIHAVEDWQVFLDWGFSAYETWKRIGKDEDDPTLEQGNTILRKFKIKLADKTADDEEEHNQYDHLNVAATIDYLRQMKETAYNDINKDAIAKVDTEKIRYILTVPAQWDDDERAAMRIMAKDAGIINKGDHENRLIIINESLAATLFCEREICLKRNTFKFQKGSRYLICDAGGGTVDLATYEATDASFNNRDSTLIGRCQLTIDSGGHCGSGFVDDNMENVLLDILFHEAEEDKKQELKYAISPLMEIFIDELKKEFKGIPESYNSDSDSDEYEYDENDEERESEDVKNATTFDLQLLNLCGDQRVTKTYREDEKPEFIIKKDRKGNGDMLHVYRDTMCIRVFDPEVEKTLSLIDNQIKKANSTKIEAIFLLGGFGESKYLQEQTKKRFKDVVGEVITDESGNLAAMQGAIYYGLEELKRSREISIISSNFQSSDFDSSQSKLLICIDREDQIYSQMRFVKVTENHLGRAQKTTYKIPTVLEYSDKPPEKIVGWGAKVRPNSSRCVTPNYMMSTSKDDFKKFITDYLKCLYEYASTYIKKERGKGIGINKIRYCLTMENSFNFFRTKKEMRDIARDAGLFGIRPDMRHKKKLLLLTREDASAMYYKKVYYTEDMYFWKIKILSNNMCCVSRHVVKNVDVASFKHTREDIDDPDKAEVQDSVKMPCPFDDESISNLYNQDKSFEEIEDRLMKPIIRDLIENIPKGSFRSNASSRIQKIDKIYVIGRFVLEESRDDMEDLILACLFKKLEQFVLEKKNIIHVDEQAQSHQDEDNKNSGLPVRSKDIVKDYSAYANRFIQINIQRDCFHLSLYETTNISDQNQIEHQNVRKLRSTTFEFDVVGKMVKRLSQYTRDKPENHVCSSSELHRQDTRKYDNDLNYGVIYYVKSILSFCSNTDRQTISISSCCTIEITPHSFLNKILNPTIKELVETMNMSIIQAGITGNHNFDHIFVSGNLLEASGEVDKVVKDSFVKYLYCSLMKYTENAERIVFSSCNDNEVIYGAAMYGLEPVLHTERVSRRTYAVSVQAHPVLTKELPLVIVDTEKQVDLHFQSKKGSSKTIKMGSETKTRLINQNDPVTMNLQLVGTFERFFADQECVVYATIYAKEEEDKRFIGAKIDQHDDSGFKKIHQFEISLKREDTKDLEQDINNTRVRSRLSFEIRLLFPDKNEAMFEANIGQ